MDYRGFGYGFREVLTRYMKEKGFNQKKLADGAGITVSAVSYLLAGRTAPKGHVLISLMEALDVDPTTFIDEVRRESKRY